MKKSSNSITLDRSPQYVAARTRYNELQAELTQLDRQLNSAYGGLGSLPQVQDLIRDEASALLEGATPAPASNRAAAIKNIDDLTHRIAVIRQAVDMQRGIVIRLAFEVSNTIAGELLPQHAANVQAVASAAVALSVALQAERELRDTLTEQGIQFASTIRAMPLPGFNLADDNSRLSRYLAEAHEYGFVKAGNLPDVVRDRLPRKVARPALMPNVPNSSTLDGSEWGTA
jgi:hypothetical protein